MEKIVFINQWSSYLTKDIINAFAEKFDNIDLITGILSESGNSLNKKIKVTHILKYNKKNTFSRQITWFFATVQVIFLVNFKFRKYHLFLTSNPPTLAFVPIFCRNKYSIQVLDIYPDALVAGGFISQSCWLNKFWRKHNKKYFAGATNVFTITNGMAKTISQYCTINKIKVIYQWPLTNESDKIEKSNNMFIKKHSLEDNFIVMYSGNVGLSHHVDTLVDTARILKDYKEIIFIIIGEGWNKPVIEKLIIEYGLKNCMVLPFQSPNMFKHSLQAADIGVVSVTKELAMLSIPIKTYNMINYNIPLLCITEGQSELAALVSRYDVGRCFGPDQITEISDFIVTLKTGQEIVSRYKQNLKRCARNFTSHNVYSYLENFNTWN